jgi:hypothetical protein
VTISQINLKRNDLRDRHGMSRVAGHIVAIFFLVHASQALAKMPSPELLEANAKCIAAYEYLEALQQANQNSDAKEARDVYRELTLIHRESLIVLAGATRAGREAARARSALARRVGAPEPVQTLGLLAQETVACEGLLEYLTEAQLTQVTSAVEKKTNSQ